MTTAFAELPPEWKALIDVLDDRDGYRDYAVQCDARAHVDVCETLDGALAQLEARESICGDHMAIIHNQRRELGARRVVERYLMDISGIKTRYPIADVVGRVVHLQALGDGGALTGICPFCRDDPATLHVVPAVQLFACGACRAVGDAVAFVERWSEMSGVTP